MLESFIKDAMWFFTTFGDQLIMSTLLFLSAVGNVLSSHSFKPGTSDGAKLASAVIGGFLVVLISPLIYMFVVNHFPLAKLHIDFMGGTVLVYLMIVFRSLLPSNQAVDNSQTK